MFVLVEMLIFIFFGDSGCNLGFFRIESFLFGFNIVNCILFKLNIFLFFNCCCKFVVLYFSLCILFFKILLFIIIIVGFFFIYIDVYLDLVVR